MKLIINALGLVALLFASSACHDYLGDWVATDGSGSTIKITGDPMDYPDVEYSICEDSCVEGVAPYAQSYDSDLEFGIGEENGSAKCTFEGADMTCDFDLDGIGDAEVTVVFTLDG
ncbi:MAG: hypothetical protein U0271_39165 [Polyangiaceae bacterium]